MKIVIGLHRNISELDRKTAQLVGTYNLTFRQFMVLEALYSKGSMTVCEVREAILSSVGTIPVIIHNLEKLQYIRRVADKKDRRVCHLELTETGTKIISEILPRNELVIREAMQELSESDKETLLHLLKKMSGRLSD